MKLTNLMGAMALCAALAPAMWSCSSEPDADNVLNIDGESLTALGGYNIGYDDKGRVVSVSDNSSSLEINYSKGTITEQDDYDEVAVVDVEFTGKGYIKKFSQSWNYTEDDEKVKGKGQVEFSYNGDGNLTEIKGKMEETAKDLETGESEDYSQDYTIKMQWRGGNMVSATINQTEKEDGQTEHYSESCEVAYSADANVFLQNTMAISEIWADESSWNVLAAAGLFGKGTAALPSQLTANEDGHQYSANASYSLNDNGSIAVERLGYTSYYYTYASLSRSVAAADGHRFAPLRSIFKRARMKK